MRFALPRERNSMKKQKVKESWGSVEVTILNVFFFLLGIAAYKHLLWRWI